MEIKRRPFQGVLNIVRFNWHFYFFVILGLSLLVYTGRLTSGPVATNIYYACILISVLTFISLFVSFYVYDLSDLYKFDWIKIRNENSAVINISAGFDETSHLIKHRLNPSTFLVLDFYDPKKHTEVSIKRAREAYPSYPGTKATDTATLHLPDNSADQVFVILSAHEIRDDEERIKFFSELKRVIKPSGEIFVCEHLRDLPNFLAYNIGFFHFYSKAAWLRTFERAGLQVDHELKNTPFISTFILSKNGISL